VADQPVVDFETHPILFGSGLAPKPVGVSVLVPGRENTYYGWGHPGANPHTWEDGRRAVAEVWDHRPLFHNCKFDISVAVEHFELPWPDRYDDTLFAGYLIDPISKSLKLKELAEKHLGEPPDEQQAVYRWLLFNFKGPFLNGDKKITETNFGAYIGYAPYDVVAPYAKGDTHRTRGLGQLWLPQVEERGMINAYNRELKIAKIGYEMEAVGVAVDREALQRDYEKYLGIQKAQEDIVCSFLGDIDVSKPRQVAKALEESPYCGQLRRTPTGLLSTAKDALEEAVTEPTLLKALRYRSTLHTLTSNFFKNWINFSAGDGNVHPSWNQVKSDKGGTRTGRFSCSEPNFQNVPTEFDDDVLEGLDIPFMRQYILPDEGQIIVPADYNGQEMRIMAHYAEGRAMEVYQNDPTADFHEVASALILQYTGLTVPRKMCKIVGFSLLYGSGVAKLAEQLGVDFNTAYKIKNAYFKAIPGLREFVDQFDKRDKVTTWGGRILPVEEPKLFQGRWWTFNYKLCNYLIQGSAADQTKEALINYDRYKHHGELLMTVHDELVITVPREHLKTEITILRSAMEDQPGWDVPFRSEVKFGNNWHDLSKYKELEFA
jgi:DNA polymerase-1